MTKALNLLIAVVAIGLLWLPNQSQLAQTTTSQISNLPSASVGGQETTPIRDGAMAMPEKETNVRASKIPTDPRYIALRKIAKRIGATIDSNRAKGLVLPEGYRAVFFPVLDKQGTEIGFLASSDEGWMLSVDKTEDERKAVQTFSAKLDPQGRVAVELLPLPDFEDVDNHHAKSNSKTSLDGSSCQYVSKLSINFGCWSPSDNPFGYYYVWTTRWGWTPDPRSPSWYACYRGAIHVCPRYQSGSYTFPVCGFPPSHPVG